MRPRARASTCVSSPFSIECYHPAHRGSCMTDSSWEGFLNDIRRAQQKLKGKPLWYRGHANSDFKLLPSLLRFHNGLIEEKALFARYEQAAIALGRDRESSWEMLFDMQHYYIPTRYLIGRKCSGGLFFLRFLRIK